MSFRELWTEDPIPETVGMVKLFLISVGTREEIVLE